MQKNIYVKKKSILQNNLYNVKTKSL